jgi:hypothetical protein
MQAPEKISGYCEIARDCAKSALVRVRGYKTKMFHVKHFGTMDVLHERTFAQRRAV